MKINPLRLIGKWVRLIDLALKIDAAWDDAERLAPREQTVLPVVRARVGKKRFAVGPLPVYREE